MTTIAVGKTFISVYKKGFNWPWQRQTPDLSVRVVTIESIQSDASESDLSVAYWYTTPCGMRGTGAMTRDAVKYLVSVH